MIALLQFRLAAILVGFASPDEVRCTPVDAGAVRLRVAAVRAASSPPEISAYLGELGADWRRRCLSSRHRASPSLVADLAGLLQIRQARWTVATMLLDVSQNLRFARGSITLALQDQLARERLQQREAYPVIPNNLNAIPQSLRCLLARIRTGRENMRLCRHLQSLRDDDQLSH